MASTLDFSWLRNALDPQKQEVFRDQLRNAITNLDLAKLISHGLDDDLILEAMECALPGFGRGAWGWKPKCSGNLHGCPKRHRAQDYCRRRQPSALDQQHPASHMPPSSTTSAPPSLMDAKEGRVKARHSVVLFFRETERDASAASVGSMVEFTDTKLPAKYKDVSIWIISWESIKHC